MSFMNMKLVTIDGGRGGYGPPYELFNEYVSKSYTHLQNAWVSAGSKTVTMGPYDLRNIVKMTCTAVKKAYNSSWSNTSAATMTWKDANGTVINGLVGTDVRVGKFATDYDLSSCTCALYITGSTKNSWESADGYKYMSIGGTFTCDVCETLQGIIYNDFLLGGN